MENQNAEKFSEMQKQLQDRECCASCYDNYSFTILEFHTIENALSKFDIDTELTQEQKVELVNKLKRKFPFAYIELSEDYYIDFEMTLLAEDVNCNIDYVVNAVHCFHDSLFQMIKTLS